MTASAEQRPFYSVVIPVYDRASVLGRALRSVLVQSLQDFEIVVVDDGSSDHPEWVVDEIADPRIRLIHQANRGGSGARNTGIDAALGRYLAFLDSDDTFLPHHLETMKKLVDGTENRVGYARIVVNRGEGRTFLKPSRGKEPAEHMAIYLMCDRGFVQTSTVVVETTVARKVRYDERLPFAQDMDFAIRLHLAGCSFVMAEKPGAVWQDTYQPDRISAGRKGERLARWLDQMRPSIPPKAYHGYRGWMIAKGIAARSRSQALVLYLTALLHGCYSPRLAVVVFLQIFLPDSLYRGVADRAAGWLRAELLRG